jgi:hypothetical protein
VNVHERKSVSGEPERSPIVVNKEAEMAKPKMTEVTKTEKTEETEETEQTEQTGETKKTTASITLPITVGNPAAAASLAIDQSHMEEFASVEEKSPIVELKKPPKGVFFTVLPETTKPWKHRAFYFLLEMEGRDAYIVAPEIANQKKEEDVIRPVLIVHYVTMAGEEGLWPLKLDPPDGRSNRWNSSALSILEVASSGKWVRLVSAKNHYRYQVSKKTFEEVPPRFSDRTIHELVGSSQKDRIVASLDHEIWKALDEGSEK